jgi:hypothetical protein
MSCLSPLISLDFSKAERDVFEGLKEIAETSRVEIWLSALAGKDPLLASVVRNGSFSAL